MGGSRAAPGAVGLRADKPASFRRSKVPACADTCQTDGYPPSSRVVKLALPSAARGAFSCTPAGRIIFKIISCFLRTF